MKKYILLAGALLVGVIASAQIEFKPFVGANFSNVSETPDGTETKAKVGYQFGIGLMIGGNLYLHPSIAYFGRNTEYSVTGEGDEDITFDQTTNGVFIPVLLGYRFIDPDDDPDFNFRLFAGPSFMYLSKTEFDNGEFDEQIDWNNTQWGAEVGAGVDISIFFVDLGYEFGLTNSYSGIKGENDIFTNFDDVRQNTFYVNAGVRLGFAD